MIEQRKRGRPRRDPREALSVLRKAPGYSFADILVLTSATRSQLLHWTTNTKTITAGIDDAVGAGNHRRYSAFNVIEAELAATISAFNFKHSTSIIFGVLDAFRHEHYGLRAIHEGMTSTPHQPSSFGSWSHIVSSIEKRDEFVKTYILRHAQRLTSATAYPWPSQEEFTAQERRLVEVAKDWAESRAFCSRGVPDRNTTVLNRFLGLALPAYVGVKAVDVVACQLVDDTSMFAQVVNDAAIVIDLKAVVWRVGQRVKQFGVTLEDW